MKNFKIKSTNFVLVLSLIFVLFLRCSKEQDKVTTTKLSNFEKLNSLTSSYLSKTHSSKLEPRTWKKFFKILGADLKGSLSGAAAGAGIGALAGGVGAGPGAIAGGIIGAAGASCEAASLCIIQQSDGDLNPVLNYNPSVNEDNPYDFIGLNHYSCINNGLESPKNYLEGNEFSATSFYNFGVDFMNNNVANDLYNFDYFTLKDNSDLLKSIKQDEANNLIEFLENTSNSFITDNIKEILNTYFQALESSQNADEFRTYSIEAENIISKSSLNPLEMQFVLGTMSTARYGFEYWQAQKLD